MGLTAALARPAFGNEPALRALGDGDRVRSERRLAVALEAGGRAGYLGGLIDLFFQPEWSIQIGGGSSRATQQVSFGLRSLSLAGSLSPTLSAGALIVSSRNGSARTADDFASDEMWSRILTEFERKSQSFQFPLLHVGLGVEILSAGRFAQTTLGEGAALGVELLYLMRPSTFVGIPTVSISLRYHL